ncbi:hypothetical protein J7M23_05060 [Candidatus Sumerlaeota bacterium]|nr:hypothetical protein [Candidatus Sumerlaeota bacterium]
MYNSGLIIKWTATTTDVGTECIRRYVWEGEEKSARWVLFEFTPENRGIHFLLSELDVIDGTVPDSSPDGYPGIKTQIELEQKYVDDFIAFDYATYMSQNQGGTSPGSVELYSDYLNYLNSE